MSNFPTRNCPQCGAPYPSGAVRCERGHPLPLICPDCGAPYQSGAVRCERGHVLPKPKAAARTPARYPVRSRPGGIRGALRTWRRIQGGCVLILLLAFGIGYVVNCVVQDFFPEDEEAENVDAPDSSEVSYPPTSAPSGVSSPPSSAQATPTSDRLPTTTGGKVYQTDDEIRVEWIVPPTISRDGRLRLKVRVLDDSLTLYPNGASDGNGLDVNIVGPSSGGRFPLPRAMYGEILPPAGPGYNWGELDETEFVADVFDFDFETRTLTLEVLTNPRLASAREIYASLWTNPPRGETPTWVNRERVRGDFN